MSAGAYYGAFSKHANMKTTDGLSPAPSIPFFPRQWSMHGRDEYIYILCFYFPCTLRADCISPRKECS